MTKPVWCAGSEMPTDAVTAGDWETYQDWSSFAYGYEITGDQVFLDKALEQFFGSSDLWIQLRNGGLTNLENRAALIALMQKENGLL